MQTEVQTSEMCREVMRGRRWQGGQLPETECFPRLLYGSIGGGGVERGDTEAELYTYRVPDDVNNFYHGSVVLLLR